MPWAKARAPSCARPFRIAGAEGQVTGEGSLILFHMSDEPLTDYRAVYRAGTDGRARKLDGLFRALLNHGVVTSVSGMACLSTPMGRGGDRPPGGRSAGEPAHGRARGRLKATRAAPSRAMSQRVLCRLDEIPDPGSKGFDFREGDALRSVFVVREGSTVRAYENSCPHTLGPLDWVPDQFLTREKDMILCATHGRAVSH